MKSDLPAPCVAPTVNRRGTAPMASSAQSNDGRTIKAQVVVAHPGRQYSHHMALALAEAGMLRKYFTGLPAHRDAGWRWVRPLIAKYAANYEIPLDASLVSHHFVSPVVHKLGSRLLPRRQSTALAHQIDSWFDRHVARCLSALRPDVVVSYENSALATFRQARSIGIVTVLDAASFHHVWQDRFYEPVESPRTHRRVIAHKDAEIELADHVLTVSQLARESYLEAGLPPERVHAMPLGVALDQFAAPNMAGSRCRSGASATGVCWAHRRTQGSRRLNPRRKGRGSVRHGRIAERVREAQFEDFLYRRGLRSGAGLAVQERIISGASRSRRIGIAVTSRLIWHGGP